MTLVSHETALSPAGVDSLGIVVWDRPMSIDGSVVCDWCEARVFARREVQLWPGMTRKVCLRCLTDDFWDFSRPASIASGDTVKCEPCRCGAARSCNRDIGCHDLRKAYQLGRDAPLKALRRVRAVIYRECSTGTTTLDRVESAVVLGLIDDLLR